MLRRTDIRRRDGLTDGNDGKEGVVSLCLRSQSPRRMDVWGALRRVSLMTGHTLSELWRETGHSLQVDSVLGEGGTANCRRDEIILCPHVVRLGLGRRGSTKIHTRVATLQCLPSLISPPAGLVP